MPPGFMKANCAPVEARCASAIRLPSADSPAAFSARRERDLRDADQAIDQRRDALVGRGDDLRHFRVRREARALIAPGRDDRGGLLHHVARLRLIDRSMSP